MVVLLVLFIILAFLTIDHFAGTYAHRRAVRTAADTPQSERRAPPEQARSLPRLDEVPPGTFIAPGHVWLQVEPAGSVRMGVDRVLLSLLGGVDTLYLVPEGTAIRRGGPLMMIRRGRRALKVCSPIDGTVTRSNASATRDPGRVSGDPFHRGWIYRVVPDRLGHALATMVVPEDATSWIRKEISRLRDLFQRYSGVAVLGAETMADGGIPVETLSDCVVDEQWEDLVSQFFSGAEAVPRRRRLWGA